MGRGRHSQAVSSRPGIRLNRGKLRTSVVLGALLGVVAFAAIAIASDHTIDLTTPDVEITHNGAVFIQGGVGAGTGNYDPFLQVQETGNGDGIQKGYNTEPASNGEFDTKGINPGNTHKLLVSAVPIQIYNDIEYREFSLDSNDTGSDSYMSIDEIKIFIDDQYALTGYSEGTETFSNDNNEPTATVVWDLDGPGDHTILANTQSLEPGSGVSDITVLIPSSVFPEECYYGSETCDKYLIFWTVNGQYTENTDGRDYDADSGFEEWRVRLLPVVNVTKTANESFTRDYSWEILKTADPTSADLFAGESQTFDYDVTVTQTVTDGAFAVSGTVTISNPTGGAVIEEDIDAEITTIADTLTEVGPVSLTCPGVTLPYTLGPGESIECTYELIGAAAFDAEYVGTNSTTVTILNDEDAPTDYSGSADVDFTDVTPTVTGYQTIDVTDTVEGPLGSASGTYTFEYSQQKTCSTNPNAYTNGFYNFDVDNVASIDETGQNDDATITVTCYLPSVSKTVTGSFTETTDWTITKGPDASYSLFAGGSVDHDYTITLDKTVTPSSYAVSGGVTVVNPHPTAALSATLEDELNDGTAVVFSGCTNSATLVGTALTVPANTTTVCSYTAAGLDGDEASNTATLTLNSIVQSDTKTITFAASQAGEPGTVNVTDDNGTPAVPGDDRPFGPFSDDATPGYTQSFSCSTDVGAYTAGSYTYQVVNTASIDETTDSDIATVNVTCYLPQVTKTADTSFTRTHDWTIVKDAVDANGATIPPEGLTLNFGQSYNLRWTITVDLAADPYVDSDYMVNGVITVSNPHPTSPVTVTVTDEFTPNGESSIAATVNCDGDNVVQVPAGGSVDCDYSIDTGFAEDSPINGINEATATMANLLSSTGTALVDFGAPDSITEVNATVVVEDVFQGGSPVTIGTATVAEAPKTFEIFTLLSSDINDVPDLLLECGETDVVNDSEVFGYDDDTKGVSLDTATRTVLVTVNCDLGCTLTQGYWKTHSEYGPAPYDETWALLPDGADTIFFLSEMSWYDVFWTPPKGGNPYYQVAHQYMAAQLNALAGASAPQEVVDALAAATAWFESITPEEAANLKGRDARTMRDWASTLADYNEGDIGPGHCDEDGFSVLAAWPMIMLSLGAAALYTGKRRGRYQREETLLD